MRRASTWILAGTLAVGAAGWAQSPDEDQAFQAVGAHVWVGRMPTPEELRAAASEVRAQTRSVPSVATGPTFQNERLKVYVGRLPGLEELKGGRAGRDR